MVTLRVARLRDRWWVRGVVIAAALLVLATGFCLFDQDEHGSGGRVTPPDLCLGMLALSLAVMPLVKSLAAGWAVSPRFVLARAFALHVPDPPPRPASLL
jgi:hypothetical protein